jgi:hypothetical protein
MLLTTHFVFTAVFARAEVSALGPFEYTALVWATLIGYAIWLDIPSTEVWGDHYWLWTLCHSPRIITPSGPGTQWG